MGGEQGSCWQPQGVEHLRPWLIPGGDVLVADEFQTASSPPARQQERCEESCTRWCLAGGAFRGMCEMDVQGSRGRIQQWWWAGGAGAGWGVGLPVPICQVRDPHAGWEATRIFLQLLRSKPWGFLLSGLVTESLSYALESHCAAPVHEKTGFGHWSPLGFW